MTDKPLLSRAHSNFAVSSEGPIIQMIAGTLEISAIGVSLFVILLILFLLWLLGIGIYLPTYSLLRDVENYERRKTQLENEIALLEKDLRAKG